MADQTVVIDVATAAAWNVQGDPSRTSLRDAFRGAFGIALPSIPNSTTTSGELIAFWMGPRSWLLVAESPDSPLDGFSDKRDALNAAGGALFDVSASRAAFRVAGPSATSVLAASCPLDLHPRRFATGSCAQSMLGHVNALFYRQDDAPTFVVMVARSFAGGVREALHGAAARYGAAPGTSRST